MKRKKILITLCAVVIAIFSTVGVTSAFALTVQENTETQPYYIVVGARAYDFVKVYVDNNTNTVMWVFDDDILALSIFNDYNYVGSGMNNSLQTSNLDTTNTNGSFLIGAFIDNSKIPQSSGNIDLSNSSMWQSWLYYDADLGFDTVNTLAYSRLSTSYAYTNLPHMDKSTSYWNSALSASVRWKPCLIWHLSSSFSIDYFADYACIGVGIQMISKTYEDAYKNGYGVGYNSGYSDGEQKGSEVKQDELIDAYYQGKEQGKLEYEQNTLPVKEQYAYDDGYSKGQEDYINIILPGKISAAKSEGYTEGLRQDNSFMALITSVVDVPIQAFAGMLNFDVLGVNLKDAILGIMTLCLVLGLCRMLLGGD